VVDSDEKKPTDLSSAKQPYVSKEKKHMNASSSQYLLGDHLSSRTNLASYSKTAMGNYNTNQNMQHIERDMLSPEQENYRENCMSTLSNEH